MQSGPHRALERRLWLAAYVVLLFGPLALLAAAPPYGATRLALFGIAIGFITLSMVLLQLVTPSRIPRFTAPFGIGALLRLHRYMGFGALVLLLVHIGVFVYDDHTYLKWLFPIHGPGKAQAGWLAAVALIIMSATSLWRRRLRMSYEGWRLWHILLGIVLLVGGTTHALLVAWYSTIGPIRAYSVVAMVVGLAALVYLRVGRPKAALGRPFVLSEVISERGDATTLQLEALGHDGAPFRPGQFAWLRLNGRPFALTEHPFSYASSSARPDRPSFTVKKLGDFTRRVHELKPGTMVFVDGPHGAWEPNLPNAGFVLIVGGVGITPAMSIIRSYADMGDSRPIQLLYGARTWDEITFREELAELQQRANLDLQYVLSEAEPGWTGATGYIDRALLERLLPPDAQFRNYFVCGPPIMIDGVMKSLHLIGIAPERVYADRFDSV